MEVNYIEQEEVRPAVWLEIAELPEKGTYHVKLNGYAMDQFAGLRYAYQEFELLHRALKRDYKPFGVANETD